MLQKGICAINLTGIGATMTAVCNETDPQLIYAQLTQAMGRPGDVFIGTIGINIQTMICHGTMLPIGAYLYATGHVKLEHKTILKAIPVFSVAVALAVGLNEIAHASGLLERETFNMFFVSPYCDPSLPVYSTVQTLVPYPLSLVIYIAGFSVAAYLMLLGAMGIRKLFSKSRSAEKTTV